MGLTPVGAISNRTDGLELALTRLSPLSASFAVGQPLLAHGTQFLQIAPRAAAPPSTKQGEAGEDQCAEQDYGECEETRHRIDPRKDHGDEKLFARHIGHKCPEVYDRPVTRLSVFAAALIMLAAAIPVILFVLQRRMMYFPDSRVPTPREVGIEGAEEVTFSTGDGLKLAGWFVRSDKAAPPVPTVLVFNGNAGNRAHRAPLAQALAQHGSNVLLFDYRGYGGNPGSPTETGLNADARAARAYLASRADVDSSRIVYFGESLGTAVALAMAVEHPPAALVLRSPFTSMVDVGRYHYPRLPVRLLLRDRFASNEAIGRLRSPLMVIAGDRDEIVPLEQSRRLYDAAPAAKAMVVIAGASHNDFELLAGEEMIGAIARFLRQHVEGAARSPA